MTLTNHQKYMLDKITTIKRPSSGKVRLWGWLEMNSCNTYIQTALIAWDERLECFKTDKEVIGPTPFGQWYISFSAAKKAAALHWKWELTYARTAARDIRNTLKSKVTEISSEDKLR